MQGLDLVVLQNYQLIYLVSLYLVTALRHRKMKLALSFAIAGRLTAIEERLFGIDSNNQTPRRVNRANSDVPSGALNHVVPMTDEDRKNWLDLHNKWRNDAAGGTLPDRHNIHSQGPHVAPSAKYLPKLSYDMDLERSAEEYAKKCNWDHSAPAGFSVLPYSVGENLYITGAHTTDTQHEPAINGWSVEHLDYSYGDGSCTLGKMCGHFTQVVDKMSTRVGCAVVDCATMVNMLPDHPNLAANGGTYAICQYYHRGNMGQFAYDYGVNGVDCPNGMDSTYPNLCAFVGEDVCNIPDAFNPLDVNTSSNRCLPGGQCVEKPHTINGIATDYDCNCNGNFQGRWCEDSTCTDVQHNIGEQLNGSAGVYFVGSDGLPDATLFGASLFFFQSNEKIAAMNWCASNADNAFACKSVVLSDFGGSFDFWLPNRLTPSEMPVIAGDGEIWTRDCSNPVSAVTPVESVATPVESVPTPVESVPTPVESVPTPVESVPTPVESVPTPVESVPTPVDSLPTPVESVPTPVESVPTPVQSVPTPVESVPTPVESVPTPVESEPTPVESVPTPIESSISLDPSHQLLDVNGHIRIGNNGHCVAAAGKSATVETCDITSNKQQWTYTNGVICLESKSTSCLEAKIKEKKGVWAGQVKVGTLKNMNKVADKFKFDFVDGNLRPIGVSSSNVVWVAKPAGKKQILSVNAIKQVSSFGTFW